MVAAIAQSSHSPCKQAECAGAGRRPSQPQACFQHTPTGPTAPSPSITATSWKPVFRHRRLRGLFCFKVPHSEAGIGGFNENSKALINRPPIVVLAYAVGLVWVSGCRREALLLFLGV